jgi:hypothetical protein
MDKPSGLRRYETTGDWSKALRLTYRATPDAGKDLDPIYRYLSRELGNRSV